MQRKKARCKPVHILNWFWRSGRPREFHHVVVLNYESAGNAFVEDIRHDFIYVSSAVTGRGASSCDSDAAAENMVFGRWLGL